MKITKIKVKNYRSIESVEIQLNKFSIFVGQNNHGKTNFFEAIEWFYSGAKSSAVDEHFNRDERNMIEVEIDFDEVLDSDIERLSTEANRTKIRGLLDGSTSFSVIKKSSDHKRRYIVSGEDMGNPQGIDTAINEFLPKLEYVNTKIRLDDVSKYKEKNPIGVMLSGVLTAIIESSQEYINFKEQFSRLFDDEDSDVRKELDRLGGKVEVYLQKQFPDGTRVKFGVNPPNFADLLKSFDTIVDDGIETKAEDKGDGMQRAIMLSIIQAFADYRRQTTGGGTFLFMIDEAELHLHPTAQRALKNALLEISQTDQVLVNTHSSVLVVENHERQKIYKVQKENRISRIDEITDLEKPDVVFDLLGGSPADLLLPKNFLIVEGKSEFEFLSNVIRRFYSLEYKGIKIIYASGDIVQQERSLHAVHKLFNPLAAGDNPIYKKRAVIFIDKPNQEQRSLFERFKNGYPYLFSNNQVFESPTETLEEYYPEEWRRTKEESNALGKEEKVKLAREVANSITQEQFENEMEELYKSLKRSKELAFSEGVPFTVASGANT